MPITYGEYTKQRKLLPLVLLADGSATVTVRTGFANAQGEWQDGFVSESIIPIPASEVSEILDALPQNGWTRRNDLAYAVYVLLVKNGHMEPGEIS